MGKVTNLYELCQMNEEQLNEIIQNSKNSKLIFEFINKTVKDLSLFQEELDFEDLNEFFETEKKTMLKQDNSKSNSGKQTAKKSSALTKKPTSSSSNSKKAKISNKK
jgi:hypothetical protein